MLTVENIFTEYPNIVNAEDARKMLNIGRNKIFELLKTGKLKSIKIGRNYKIPKQYIIDFLNQNNKAT